MQTVLRLNIAFVLLGHFIPSGVTRRDIVSVLPADLVVVLILQTVKPRAVRPRKADNMRSKTPIGIVTLACGFKANQIFKILLQNKGSNLGGSLLVNTAFDRLIKPSAFLRFLVHGFIIHPKNLRQRGGDPHRNGVGLLFIKRPLCRRDRRGRKKHTICSDVGGEQISVNIIDFTPPRARRRLGGHLLDNFFLIAFKAQSLNGQNAPRKRRKYHKNSRRKCGSAS